MKPRATFLTGIAVLLAMGCTPVSDSQSGRSLQVFSTIELGPTGTARFREFRQSTDFFGAMYVTEDGRGGGRQGAAPTLADAKRAAKATCDDISAKHADGMACVLYATVEPVDPTATDGLPAAAFQSLERARSRTAAGRFAALSMNTDGAFATAGNAASQREANRTALEGCNASAGKMRVRDSPAGRATKTRFGAYKCRVLVEDSL
ncbi:hypothetical protein [uncultured Roseobacter sp.]|uniref:hypothetical protein n=1 Tax=uncultured Roseobacter sp. TaxID=114847 RepID=UPI0026284F4B|nr:hypothetical protein [uncultured Roseobacter sp.]